jgi:hypothetical protein
VSFTLARPKTSSSLLIPFILGSHTYKVFE